MRSAMAEMGEVYLAARADDEFRKYFAIKLVNPGLNADLRIQITNELKKQNAG